VGLLSSWGHSMSHYFDTALMAFDLIAVPSLRCGRSARPIELEQHGSWKATFPIALGVSHIT
jgi:hypothetical protein